MTNRWKIDLKLYTYNHEPQLSTLIFQCPLQADPIVGVRSSRVRRGETSFRWTPGTISLTLLFIQAKLNACAQDRATPVLQGRAGSPAVALVNAILRYRMWLFDLFGVDKCGSAVLSNILIIQNQRLRAAGPVRVYLKEGFFDEETIRISVDGNVISRIDELKLLKLQLMKNFGSVECPNIPPMSKLFAANSFI